MGIEKRKLNKLRTNTREKYTSIYIKKESKHSIYHVVKTEAIKKHLTLETIPVKISDPHKK